MSAIKFHCPTCDQPIEGDEEYLGREIECPSCGNPMTCAADVTCQSCGAALSPHATRCFGCGSESPTSEKASTSPQSKLKLSTPHPRGPRPGQTPPSQPDEVPDFIAQLSQAGKASPASKRRSDSSYDFLKSISEEVRKLPQFQKKRPGRGRGFKAFLQRATYAAGLNFKEKELIVFGLLQWVTIGAVYYLWVQVLGWIPEETWERLGAEEGISWVEIGFFIWSVFCILLAAFPLGILTGCMGAVHFLHRRGEPSTVARCLQIVMPHAGRLWMFHAIDAMITVQQILERLPQKDRKKSGVSRAASEALYYAWKLGTCGVSPALVLGKGLIGAGKESLSLVKHRFADVSLLRVGYSSVCWVLGILTYVGALYFFWATDFFASHEGASQGIEITMFFKLAGIPLLISVGVIQLFVRPIFVISMCDIYSEFLDERGETVELGTSPGRGTAVLVAFGLLACILSVGTLYMKPLLEKFNEKDRAIQPPGR